MIHPDDFDDAALGFLAERHLATLVTARSDGTAHAVPVAFMYDHDERRTRIVAPATSVKVANIRRTHQAVLSFVDGGRWATLEGRASVRTDAKSVERTLTDYRAKYGPPHGARNDFVSIEIEVERAMVRFAIPEVDAR